jgi:Fe-S-cluster containining protein
MSSETIKSYLDCDKCKNKCCSVGKAYLDSGESVPQDHISGDWFEIDEASNCYYFSGEKLCDTYAQKPFQCEAYPFAVVDGSLYIDPGCPGSKDVLKELRKSLKKIAKGKDKPKDREIIDDLTEIKTWILNNAPATLLTYWDTEDTGGLWGTKLEF